MWINIFSYFQIDTALQVFEDNNIDTSEFEIILQGDLADCFYEPEDKPPCDE